MTDTALVTGAASGIGLACGAGQMPLAAMATALTVAVLWILKRVVQTSEENS